MIGKWSDGICSFGSPLFVTNSKGSFIIFVRTKSQPERKKIWSIVPLHCISMNFYIISEVCVKRILILPIIVSICSTPLNSIRVFMPWKLLTHYLKLFLLILSTLKSLVLRRLPICYIHYLIGGWCAIKISSDDNHLFFILWVEQIELRN